MSKYRILPESVFKGVMAEKQYDSNCVRFESHFLSSLCICDNNQFHFSFVLWNNPSDITHLNLTCRMYHTNLATYSIECHSEAKPSLPGLQLMSDARILLAPPSTPQKLYTKIFF